MSHNAHDARSRQPRRRELALFALALAMLMAWCALIVGFSAGTGAESQSLSDGACGR